MLESDKKKTVQVFIDEEMVEQQVDVDTTPSDFFYECQNGEN